MIDGGSKSQAGLQERSEDEVEAELGGEGDADGGSEAEEIAESAGGCAQLTEAGDGARLRAGGVEAEGGSVRKIVDRGWKSGNVRNEVVAGIPAIEEIEEFGEGAEREAFAKNDVAADAKIDLIERSAAELVEGGLYAIDDGAIVGAEQRKGRKLVTAVLVNALLMLVGDTEAPIAAERVFVGGAG